MLTTVAGAALTMLLITTPMPAQSGTDGCKVLDDIGSCSVIAVDPGRPGRPHHPAPEKNLAPAPPRTPQPLPDGANAGVNLGLPNPPAANPPAPPPAVLAQVAIKSLGLSGPHIRTSAPDSTFVGAPLWLWIDQGAQFTGPLSTTATAGAAQVTVTGTLMEIDWDLGPPGAHLRCLGPGTPWTGQAGPSPDCGYTYTQRSPARTHQRNRPLDDHRNQRLAGQLDRRLRGCPRQRRTDRARARDGVHQRRRGASPRRRRLANRNRVEPR